MSKIKAIMPAVFFGHGNPMHAIRQNGYTQAWNDIGKSIPTPKAIVCISAHWYRLGVAVTAMPNPRTIHDFGGFPKELFEVEYPAPGDPQLARRIRDLLTPLEVELDEKWGLDHGTWAVLRHVFPNAEVPILQLSIDETQAPTFHYELGKRLFPLREEGVLIVGSGNLVHNLHAYAWGRHPVEPFDWAVRFERRVKQSLLADDDISLVDYEHLGPDALLSVPTPEHYLPFLYILGLRTDDDKITFPVEGIDGGSISMLSIKLEAKQ